MKLMLKGLSAITLSFGIATAFATPPTYLTTYNHADKDSRAFIDGTVPSPDILKPRKAPYTKLWNIVRLACQGHTTKDKKCKAVIKMDPNDKAIVVGTLTMNLDTGDITPISVSGNGYTIKVLGAGEVEITKD